MRKLIVSMNVTLDGFLSGPHCELDWHFQSWSSEMAEYACEQLGKADTIVLGRVTYKAMANYWTSKAADLSFAREDLDFAEMMNTHTKVVFSKTLKTPIWNNSRIVKGRIADEIAWLKEKPGKDILIYGSASMVASLISLHIVDEFQIWVHPVLLGKGKPLFKGLLDKLTLSLYKTHTFRSGVVLLCYTTKQPTPVATVKPNSLVSTR